MQWLLLSLCLLWFEVCSISSVNTSWRIPAPSCLCLVGLFTPLDSLFWDSLPVRCSLFLFLFSLKTINSWIPFFKKNSVSLYLFIGEQSPFTFKVIIERYFLFSGFLVHCSRWFYCWQFFYSSAVNIRDLLTFCVRPNGFFLISLFYPMVGFMFGL